jgi:hypothetical protein
MVPEEERILWDDHQLLPGEIHGISLTRQYLLLGHQKSDVVDEFGLDVSLFRGQTLII